MHGCFWTIDDVSCELFRTQTVVLSESISNHHPQLSVGIIAINRLSKLHSHWIALKKHSKLLFDSFVWITDIPLNPPVRGAVTNRIVYEILVAMFRGFTPKSVDKYSVKTEMEKTKCKGGISA
jgi:hypothetical protein